MSRHRNALSNEKGFALFYMAVFLTVLLIFVGLAVDTGRAYVVQAQLSKAVDGAALGAARMLNSGNPQQEAANIYRANFPNGWMGTSSSTSPSDAGFYSMTTDATTGVNVVNVRATAVVPTTFMKLANFQQLTVNAQGEATRRMVDLSLVMDVSSSIGWRWQYVRDAARTFVDAFDAEQRSSVTHLFRERRPRHRCDAGGPRVRQGQSDGRHPQQSARWQHRDGAGPVIEDGTSCGRFPTASSRASVSSCSSPTARPTAFPAFTTRARPGCRGV